MVWEVAEYMLGAPSSASSNNMMNDGIIGSSNLSGVNSSSSSGSSASTLVAGGITTPSLSAPPPSYNIYSPDLYVCDRPKHILYGHDDEVTCVACHGDLDIVVSGSKDGTCMIHTLRSGRYIRSIIPPSGLNQGIGVIRYICISAVGHIATYSLLDQMLHVFTLNGRHLSSIDTQERLYVMLFTQDGTVLFTGGDRKQISVYHIDHIQPLHLWCRLPAVDTTIRSICLDHPEQHLFVGTLSGQLYVYGLKAQFLKSRFIHRLQQHLNLSQL